MLSFIFYYLWRIAATYPPTLDALSRADARRKAIWVEHISVLTSARKHIAKDDCLDAIVWTRRPQRLSLHTTPS